MSGCRIYVGGLTDRTSERELDDEVWFGEERERNEIERGAEATTKRQNDDGDGQAGRSFLMLIRRRPLSCNQILPPVRPLRPHPQHLDRTQAPGVRVHRVRGLARRRRRRQEARR